MKYVRDPLIPLALLFLVLLPARAGAQAAGAAFHRFGIAVGAGVGGAPLGEIAERNGTFAIPGKEYELRGLLQVSPGAEWSMGLLVDDYSLDQQIEVVTRSRFDYQSAAVVVAYGRTEMQKNVPIQSRLDVGWRRFEVSSSGPNYYTGEAEASRTSGHSALVAVSLGVAIPLQSMSLVPRVRLETSYPDFGGGDGYSRLHREHDLGFRASLGIGLTRMFGRDSR